jgi:ATP-dependent Clp protease protease subunit
MAAPKHQDSDLDNLHEHGIHVKSRTIFLRRQDYIDGEESDPGVDHVFATKFLKNLFFLEILSHEPITIIMSTPGGLETEGMAIFDAIKSSPCHITIVVRGEASSMGSYILQSADERCIAPNSILMMHYGSSNGYGLDHKKTAKSWIVFEEKYGKKLDEILFQKILSKHPEFKRKKFDDMLNFDTILTAEEAVELGLADKILRVDKE